MVSENFMGENQLETRMNWLLHIGSLLTYSTAVGVLGVGA